MDAREPDADPVRVVFAAWLTLPELSPGSEVAPESNGVGVRPRKAQVIIASVRMV